MGVYSYVKRRILAKSFPFFKRVVIPCMAIYIILHVITRSSPPTVEVQENLIVPGEALDPIERKSDEEKIVKIHKKVNKTEKPEVNKFKSEENTEKAKNEPQNNVLLTPFTTPEKLEVPPSKSTQKEFLDNSDVPPRIKTDWSMAKHNVPDAHKVKFRPHAITNDTVTLTLMSSADKVFMSLNKKEIYRGIDKRGMHVVVINQYSGRVMAKRVFDTALSGVEEDMIDFLDDITDGRIIVFAVLDDVATGLTWKGRNALKQHGCRFSEKIAYRDMWAMATRKGGLKIAETYSNVATADTGYEWGGPIFMRSDFDFTEEPVECKWPYNEKNKVRRHFCLRYEGYGALCRCSILHWEDVFFKSSNNELHKNLSNNPLSKELAVVILATKRPHYLYRTLKSLYESPGYNKDLVAIYTEKATKEVAALAELFGVKLVETGTLSNTSSIQQKIRKKVQRVFSDIFDAKFTTNVISRVPLFESYSPSNVLILEEDFEVAIDLFKFLHSVHPILGEDSTVLAISAFNYNGYKEIASSQTTLYRTNDAHGLALMLPKRTIKNIIVPKWPSANSDGDWWDPLISVMKANQGDIVYPEIPRAKHSSFEGFLIKGGVQKNWFTRHALSLTTEYDIPREEIKKLRLENYKNAVEHTIKNSKIINFDFCKLDLIYGEDPQLTYVEYDGKDATHLNYVFKCLEAFSIYPESGWRGVWQFHYHGHLLTIVAVPYSQFSKYKTSDIIAVTAPSNKTENA